MATGAQRRADEVREVQPARVLAPQREHHRERRARQQEGEAGGGEVEGQPVGMEREAHDRPQAERDGRRVQQGQERRLVERRREAPRAGRCSPNPPSPQPSRATEMATNAKWYQMVAEKIRVSPISNMRPESVMRKTARLNGH